MATVHLAREVSQGTLVALKRLRPELAAQEEQRHAFEREARIGAALEHPNIVRVLAWSVDAAYPFIALEYVRGWTLRRLVNEQALVEGTLPGPEARALCLDLARAVAFAHARGVLHRDLSPENVLVGQDGVARLTDFGISRVLGQTRLSIAGSVKGKFGYLAPELFESGDPSLASDVFSLAATMYFTLCGVEAFQGTSEAQLIRAVLSSSPPSPERLNHQVPPGLSALISRCLSREPAQRPRAAELETMLAQDGSGTPAVRSALGGRIVLSAPASLEEAESPRATVARIRPRRTWLRWAWGLPMVGALAALGLWAAAGEGEEPAPDTAVEPVVEPVARVAAPVPTAEPLPEEAPPRKVTGPRPSRRPARPAPTPAAPEGDGALDIRVSPWAQVFVDGKAKGSTPIQGLRLSPGPHSVILVNPQLNARRSLTVQVESGRTEELKVVLE